MLALIRGEVGKGCIFFWIIMRPCKLRQGSRDREIKFFLNFTMDCHSVLRWLLSRCVTQHPPSFLPSFLSLIYSVYIRIEAPPSSSPSPTLLLTFSHSSLPSSSEGEAHQVPSGLNISSPTEARQDSRILGFSNWLWNQCRTDRAKQSRLPQPVSCQPQRNAGQNGKCLVVCSSPLQTVKLPFIPPSIIPSLCRSLSLLCFW